MITMMMWIVIVILLQCEYKLLCAYDSIHSMMSIDRGGKGWMAYALIGYRILDM